MPEPLVVAIDGPSGVGKSTVSRLLAERLGLPVLDTGAMYRTIALAVLEKGIDLGDQPAVVRAADEAALSLRPAAGGQLEVLLDGQPVGPRLRSPEVSDATSRLSVYPEIRRRLVALQRAAAAAHGAVVEGRDIGTVVFPDTPHKFFLDARDEVRVARRQAQLAAAGICAQHQQVAAAVAARDSRDAARAESPLICDHRYVCIDTTERSPADVVGVMLQRILAR